VAIGEVGLSGEIRRVGGLGRRLAEAARQGYTTALVPEESGPHPQGMRLLEVADLASAFSRLW
jgi:DNA repair protein RadA/Sms